jgi:TPR repeat protein
MKKKPKGKQNWFKTQFKKHPYLYTFVIGWPILFYIIDEFINPIVSNRFGYILLIIFLSFPVIIFFLWFRKNKSKIKPFFKRIYKPILYFLGSIGSLIVIFLIVGIIATRGTSNFIERVKFEIIVLKANYGESPFYGVEQLDYDFDNCSIEKKGFATWGMLGEDFADFEFRVVTQFLDYYEHDILKYKSNDNQIFNHCLATRMLLKEAHHNKQIAKEILAAYPPELRDFYEDPLNKGVSILSKYTKILDENNLNNPALMYSYAYNYYLDEGVNNYKPKGLEYFKQSAEDGYLPSVSELISFHYSAEKNFKVLDCKTLLKYNNILVEEKAFIPYIITFWTYMGKRWESGLSKRIYQCTNDKHDFSKAYSLVKEIHHPRFQYWKALFILNGWGDAKQDYNKAYELFSKTQTQGVVPSLAYLSYMNFKGLGVPKNPKKGLDFAIKLIEGKYVSEDGSLEANQKSIKDYIKLYMENFFKNPDLLKTLNYLGEPK